MNESALQWLTNRVSLSGTLACGLRRPDGNCVCHSLQETFSTATIEKILGCFESNSAAVSGDLPSPRWSTWSFEQGQIRFVERPDGWRFVVVVKTESHAAVALDSLSEEFLAASLDNS